MFFLALNVCCTAAKAPLGLSGDYELSFSDDFSAFSTAAWAKVAGDQPLLDGWTGKKVICLVFCHVSKSSFVVLQLRALFTALVAIPLALLVLEHLRNPHYCFRPPYDLRILCMNH